MLIGTNSVDKSELLSKKFTENNIVHTVLNAKQDQLENEIISNA